MALPDAPRDVVSAFITLTAIVVFVAIGGSVVTSALRHYFAGGAAADQTLVVAMLLNVALILFGWRRQRELMQAVSVSAAAEERANQLATRDPLTGFHNRRSFVEEGAAMIARGEKRGKAVALLILDLDHFKTVNDMHGHEAGDALLREVADVIAATLPGNALSARFGGDEFACAFLLDPAHPDTVDHVAERIVTALGQPIHSEGLLLHVSASVGVARSDREEGGIDALLRSADIALGAAKSAGRNRFAWFTPAMERELRARNDMEVGLRSAIPRAEVVPYFEQQIDIATGSLTGFEVLARWDHPTRGLIGPESFIPVAEESGMIADLSLAIMRQAFLAARDWHGDLTLAINISPWQMKDAWLAQKIIKVLSETGFPAERLEIELTENALFDNLALAQSVVASLKNQGIGIVLDDFGKGYSSLAHLRALPFDRIKIDRSFVGALSRDTESAAIVNAITRLADSLNLPITAEGIENEETLARVRALGCARGQGYVFARPADMGGTRRLLAERRLLWQHRSAPEIVAGSAPDRREIRSQAS